MACLRAKKFLIFHHSAPFVMENCTIYQTSETSLWENVARLEKTTVQSLIIVAPVKSGLFHVGSVWFGLIPTNSEVSHSLLYSTKDLILNGQWWYTAAVGINGRFIFHWIHVSLISPLRPPTSSHNACQTKLQHNLYPFTYINHKLLAVEALNISGVVLPTILIFTLWRVLAKSFNHQPSCQANCLKKSEKQKAE